MVWDSVRPLSAPLLGRHKYKERFPSIAATSPGRIRELHHTADWKRLNDALTAAK